MARIDTERPESSYQALARELREQVLKGVYTDGRALPTETELAQQRGLSRQTVRRAFQELVVDGLVYRVRGRGTFATSRDSSYIRQFGSVEDLMGLSVDTLLQVVSPPRRTVDVDAASRLQLPNDAVVHMVFHRVFDGAPFCLSTICLPPEVGSLLIDDPDFSTPGSTTTATIIGFLDEHLPHPITEAHQSVTVALATESVAESLGCEVGHPLLRIDRLYLDSRGKGVELAVNYFLPEHYSYRTRLRRNQT